MILGWPMSRSTSCATAATASSRARIPAATTRWSARPPAMPTASTQFNNLTAGTYFVQEVAVPGLVIASSQSVQTVVITSADLQGTAGTTIDSFASTSQYVSGSLHGGKTGTSSAIDPGRHRRPSQPVRATHLGRGRRVAGRELRLARPAGLWRQRGLQRHLLGQLGRQQQQRRRAEPDRPGPGRHHVARRQHGHRAQRGRRPRQRFHHAQGLQRCERLVLGQRSHHQHHRRFAEQQRQPVRRVLRLHGRRRHGGQLLPGRRHPVVDQRRECHRRPGGTDRGRRTDGLQRELRQRGPGRPVRGQVGLAQPGRGRQPTDLYLHHDQQRPLRAIRA